MSRRALGARQRSPYLSCRRRLRTPPRPIVNRVGLAAGAQIIAGAGKFSAITLRPQCDVAKRSTEELGRCLLHVRRPRRGVPVMAKARRTGRSFGWRGNVSNQRTTRPPSVDPSRKRVRGVPISFSNEQSPYEARAESPLFDNRIRATAASSRRVCRARRRSSGARGRTRGRSRASWWAG